MNVDYSSLIYFVDIETCILYTYNIVFDDVFDSEKSLMCITYTFCFLKCIPNKRFVVSECVISK